MNGIRHEKSADYIGAEPKILFLFCASYNAHDAMDRGATARTLSSMEKAPQRE
jgi:hypothetical protein